MEIAFKHQLMNLRSNKDASLFCAPFRMNEKLAFCNGNVLELQTFFLVGGGSNLMLNCDNKTFFSTRGSQIALCELDVITSRDGHSERKQCSVFILLSQRQRKPMYLMQPVWTSFKSTATFMSAHIRSSLKKVYNLLYVYKKEK